jgi:hypothetical protein
MRRIALLLVAVLALAGCRIFTVLDGDDFGDGFFDVVDVERLPGGGFVAVSCGFDSYWGGRGIIIVRPDQPRQNFPGCSGPLDVSVAADGDIFLTKNDLVNFPGSYTIERLDPTNGSRVTVFTFDREITTVVKAPDGRLLFAARDTTADSTGFVHTRIYEATGATSFVPVAGAGDLGRFDFAVDESGTIFASGGARSTDPERHKVFEVTLDGTRTVIAGTGEAGFSGDGHAATAARLDFPTGVEVNSEGDVFIAVGGDNGRVRRIDTTGVIRTVAGGGTADKEGWLALQAKLEYPVAVAVESGQSFWVVEAARRVRFVGEEAP